MLKNVYQIFIPRLRGHIALAALSLSLVSSHAVDLDLDGLPDLWQQYYKAQDTVGANDDDKDGFTNTVEALAGTDPYLNTDHPKSGPVWMDPSGNPLHLSFSSELGKFYQLNQSNALDSFSPLGPLFPGNGSFIDFSVDQVTGSNRYKLISHQLWANVSGNNLSSLTDLSTYPEQADGTSALNSFEIAPSIASGFGGRFRALITPSQDGNYTFYLSSAGAAELHLSGYSTVTFLAKQAEVLSAQTGILPNQWNVYPNQQSSAISLTAGIPYLLEIRYLAPSALAHCQAAWSGPGISGIEVIPSSAIISAPLFPEAQASSPLLNRDYDSTGQTSLLWSEGTTLTSGVSGMSGNAESFQSDPVGSADRITLPQSTSEHFYATFLLQMTAGHDEVNLHFRNSDTSSQEGPRIDLEESGPNGERAVIRAGGSGASETEIEITYGETYRVEIVASLHPFGFSYQADLAELAAIEDRFDLYVSDTNGKLIGSALGLTFRDSGKDIVQKIDMIHASSVRTPHITFDDWEISGGSISGKGFLKANSFDFEANFEKHFFRVDVSDSDQDSDGISDWAELKLAKHQPYLFFDSQSTPGISDTTAITDLLNAQTAETVVSLAASDTAAFESNSPNLTENHGQITITRTGPLTPIEIRLCQEPLAKTGNTETICDGTCCSLVGSAGNESAEIEDYTLLDAQGNLITTTVTFEFGEMNKVITVKATPDNINEYPETLNLAVEVAENNEYQISQTTNGASIQLFDLPEHPDNFTLFTGGFNPESGVVSGASGSTSALLNGPRTQLIIDNTFSGLTSNQQDSHIHKSNIVSGGGPSAGSIIYAITETPGDDETDPLNGPISSYPWDISTSSGAVSTAGGPASKQTIIDSLFGQNGESPLYLNIHTVDYPAGEIWALLNLSGGSQTDPGAPTPALTAGSEDYPQLNGEELASEVRRFLNQATFGATDAQVNALVSTIETERATDSTYHRSQAYSDWIDSQMTLQQTYYLDYSIATDFQHYVLGGAFDPTRNPSTVEYNTPTAPAIWPQINRSAADSEHWHLDLTYPISDNDLRLISSNGLRAEPRDSNRRHVLWQMMINNQDQLRTKMGFALQQIVVISAESSTLRDQPYGMANYMDQLNANAFKHYRDVLGFVNWSPMMGKWLSSLQNQKAADLDDDGSFDIFPDENLARENMQLFSIGLFELWPDGTLRLGSDGLPIPTYTNTDIQEFAKILTGQSFGRYNSTSDPWGGTAYADLEENEFFYRGQGGNGLLTMRYNYPMKMFGEFHDLSVKTFAGTTIDHTSITDPSAQGVADIESAIDWLAGKPGDGLPDFDMVNSHRSTPAFICRRLIQRFTSSNPSRDYLHRVATVFKDSEGNLGQTIKAILLDSEARIVDLNDNSFGLKKSPLEAYIQLVRSIDSFSYMPLTDPQGAPPFDSAPGNFTNANLYLDTFNYPSHQIANQERNLRFMQDYTITSGSTDLQMVPMRQETVFNWYLPDYSPGGAIADAGLVAPELQLANEPDLIRAINFFQQISRSSNGSNTDRLGGTTENQRLAFGTTDDSADNNTRIRLNRAGLAGSLYPSSPPTPINSRTSESLADEILLDELDRRLTLGYLKRKYPYDSSDDDDPNIDGVDDLLKNPRELIIDALSAHNDPYSGNNDDSDRINKTSDALYLLTLTPEFQIKK